MNSFFGSSKNHFIRVQKRFCNISNRKITCFHNSFVLFCFLFDYFKLHIKQVKYYLYFMSPVHVGSFHAIKYYLSLTFVNPSLLLQQILPFCRSALETASKLLVSYRFCEKKSSLKHFVAFFFLLLQNSTSA